MGFSRNLAHCWDNLSNIIIIDTTLCNSYTQTLNVIFTYDLGSSNIADL